MNIKHLNVGIIHSLIGKNDGVSIVIDQTINAMIKYMGFDLGNIYFLAAHSSPRFNVETDDVFWHKNKAHKEIVERFCSPNTEGLEETIVINSRYAQNVIESFVKCHDIDLLIVHNTSHPLNFLTAVGLGYFIEKEREKGVIWPKVICWWHDSYFERERFSNPNPVIKKFLKYLPGTYLDGIVFINQLQSTIAKRYYETWKCKSIEAFFEDRTKIVPNTTDIPWDWKSCDFTQNKLISPKLDNYNFTFFKDLGIIRHLHHIKSKIEDTVFLLQHTRIVPRKRIEVAVDFAFRLEKKFASEGHQKTICLLVSGHSGDEQNEYRKFVLDYFEAKRIENPDAKVIFILGEDHILSCREIIVDKKYYNFSEVPSIIAAHGGMGTYFSDVEGFGNNLLEMLSNGLPVAINKYEVYKTDIEHYGLQCPSIENCELTNQIIDDSYLLLTNFAQRNQNIVENLKILESKLDHRIVADKLVPLIKNVYMHNITLT